MISLVKSVILIPSLFLLKYLLLEGRNWYFFEKLITKKMNTAINCRIICSCRHPDIKAWIV